MRKTRFKEESYDLYIYNYYPIRKWDREQSAVFITTTIIYEEEI